MDKRLILALALSLVVLFAFQYMFKPPQQPVTDQQEIYTKEEAESPVTPVMSGVSGKAGKTIKSAIAQKEEEAYVSTEKYDIVFSDIGADVKKWRLKEFSMDEDEVFVEAEDPVERMFAMRSDELKGLDQSKFTVDQREGILEYSLKEEGFLEIKKTYKFYKSSDHIGLEINITNLSPARIPFSYTLTGPAGMPEAGAIKGRNFLEADASIDGQIVKKRAVKESWTTQGSIAWVALKNRYFAAILKPFEAPAELIITGNKQKKLATFLKTKNQTIAPGATITNEYVLYAGPVDENRIAAMGHNMENIVDYGWFGGISKVLLTILRFFHKWVRNWGLAIIMLTMLINMLTFPLTRKSFTSMHQMKKVQPHMAKLKEIHKDNPQRLNKEMMELYKKYNVNPFGGCLPMLLQIPIFIALYQGLIRSVELKGASFLWIKDLARPDAAKLPFTLPFIGNHINILPLLMVVMMIVQQKISQGAAGAMTDEQAQQQKMMMLMMPLVFGFLFYNMPSGLVLYWLTNTILMSTEQGLLAKTMRD